MLSPVDPQNAARVLEVVGEALELPAAERTAFLQTACAENMALRAEIESLLCHQTTAAPFFDQPVFVIDPEILRLSVQGELQPGDKLGDYRIGPLLGEGGMGEVYLAEDTVLGRQVAIKLLKRHPGSTGFDQHFRHERKVLAGLTHPNIARLYGSGTTAQGQAYLVMECVEGTRLDHDCEQRGLDIDARLHLFRKVCAAVAYAHQNLVVHRDLKPANIRVTAEGEPKLLDFGIAKLLEPAGSTVPGDPTLTMLGAMTPEYASPEQIKGEPITTASDVYSLGVILYELLTGQRLYPPKSRRPDELARAICEEEPPRPSTVAGKTTPTAATTSTGTTVHPRTFSPRLHHLLAGDLDNIVGKALRKDPARRYPSVLALSEDIRRHCEGLPVSARRDTLGYRTGKFVRRNKVAVAAATLTLLALVLGLAAATWQAHLVRLERDRARLAQKQSERLNGFLESLLGSVDPDSMGKDVKVAEVLNAASQKLDLELADEPAILAQAHDTLSRAYRHLGLLEPAERHARAALESVRRLYARDHPAVARAETALATILCDRFLFDEADSLSQHALAVQRRQTVPDHAALAETLGDLSYSLSSRGRLREAEAPAREALGQARVAWGEKDRGYLGALNQLANLKTAERDYAAAESFYRRLITLYDQLTPGGTGSLVPQLNLCICLFNEEKLADTQSALERLERDARRLVGEQGLPFAFAIYGRGCVAFARGDYQAAIPPLRQALGVLTANYPPGQTTVVQCRGVLGLSLTRTGHAADGEALLRNALANGARLDRSDFDHTLGNLEGALGECLAAQSRDAEAEPLLVKSYEELGSRLGEHHPMTIRARARLHDFYAARNQPAQAARFAVLTR